MRRCTVVLLAAAASVFFGCNRPTASAAPPPAPPRAASGTVATQAQLPSNDTAEGPPVAYVNGRPISLQQLQKPLIEAYGLNMLLNLVQLDLAREQARRAGVVVSPEDVVVERDMTIHRLFPDAEPDEYEYLFDQFLQQQRLTRTEFDMLLATNANLRRVVEPQVRGKISEDAIREAFNQTYGETVRVRHIQLGNMGEVVEAKRRLGEGEDFEQVAFALSRNARTGPLGGELPQFSRAATAFPQAFRDAAFALKPGEVSDPVQADGYFHLILLEEKVAPKAVEFDHVKESVREDLEDKLIQAAVQRLRNQLAQETLRSLKIEEPVLRDQLARRVEARDAPIRDEEGIRREWERQRDRIRGADDTPATGPARRPMEFEFPPDEDDAADPPAPPVPATQPSVATQPAATQP